MGFLSTLAGWVFGSKNRTPFTTMAVADYLEEKGNSIDQSLKGIKKELEMARNEREIHAQLSSHVVSYGSPHISCHTEIRGKNLYLVANDSNEVISNLGRVDQKGPWYSK